METIKILSLIENNNNNLECFKNFSIPICYFNNNSKVINLPNYIYSDEHDIVDNDKINQFIEIININKNKTKNKTTKKIKTQNNNKTKKK